MRTGFAAIQPGNRVDVMGRGAAIRQPASRRHPPLLAVGTPGGGGGGGMLAGTLSDMKFWAEIGWLSRMVLDAAVAKTRCAGT